MTSTRDLHVPIEPSPFQPATDPVNPLRSHGCLPSSTTRPFTPLKRTYTPAQSAASSTSSQRLPRRVLGYSATNSTKPRKPQSNLCPQDLAHEKLAENGMILDPDGHTVHWAPSNPDHPRNWSVLTKAFNLFIVYWLEFFMTLISTAGTPAAQASYSDYGISKLLAYFAFVSIYLLGQLLGGMICSPISESFGSRSLYILSGIIYAGFSILIPLVPSLSVVLIGRFITGFVAAVPAVVAFGTIEDIFDTEQRIWIIYFYNLLANAALSLGPIYGVYLTESVGWKWIFYISAIVVGVGASLAFFMSESRAPVLLERKIRVIRETTGYHELTSQATDRQRFNFNAWVLESLFRPLYFLVSQPIVILCTALISIAYALIYGLTESISIVYQDFGWSKVESSLAFLAVLGGMFLSIIPRFFEQRVFKRYHEAVAKDAKTLPLKPEAKIRSFALSAPAIAIGLWTFAWTIPPLVHVHWTVSMIGLALIGYASNDFDCILFNYITDCYGGYTASAVSSITICRSLLAAAIPLFTNEMYIEMGSNYATTLLAGVATLFAFTPILFFGFAKQLRRASRYALNDEEAEEIDDVEIIRHVVLEK